MSFKTRETRYVECDGCGYELGERRTTLELAYAEGDTVRGKLTLHFHEARVDHDCLRYWLTGTGIMERTLAATPLLSEAGRDVILRSVGARKDPR